MKSITLDAPNFAVRKIGVESIDRRVAFVADRTKKQYPKWPCGRGCDGCCRKLAESPRITAPEWRRLRRAIFGLSETLQQKVTRGIHALKGQAGPVTCPMLDDREGACMVYEDRPIACRTYGYYDQRGIGLYCTDIERGVVDGRWEAVIWGNQDGIDADLKVHGPPRALHEWLSDDGQDEA